MATEAARRISTALASAGLDEGGGGDGPGSRGEFGLAYRVDAPDPYPGRVYVSF